MLLTKQNNRDIVPDTYTTFLGSNYSIYIAGELTKAHVQEAEAVIGTIKGVQIGTAVTSIGYFNGTTDTAPFYGKTALKTLTFKGSSTCIYVGRYCFQGCTGLTSIALPNSIEFMERYAFYGCTGLTTLTFGNSLTTLEDYIFYGCTGLTTLTFPASLISVSEQSFGNTTLSSVIFTGSGTIKTLNVNTINNGNNPFSSPQSLVDACTGVNTINIPAEGITYT
jgi:hypothetical protein